MPVRRTGLQTAHAGSLEAVLRHPLGPFLRHPVSAFWLAARRPQCAPTEGRGWAARSRGDARHRHGGPRGYGRYSSPPLTRARTPIGRRRFRPRGPIPFTLKAPPGSPRSGLWYSVPPPQIRSVTSRRTAWPGSLGSERNETPGPKLGCVGTGPEEPASGNVSRDTPPLWGVEVACPHCGALKYHAPTVGH